MVQRIECISPELQIDPIRNQRKDLGEAEVLVEVLWPTEVVTAADGESDWTRKVTLCPDWIGEEVYLATGGFVNMGLNSNTVAVEDRGSIVGVAGYKGVRVGPECLTAMPG